MSLVFRVVCLFFQVVCLFWFSKLHVYFSGFQGHILALFSENDLFSSKSASEFIWFLFPWSSF